jgi:hypothetical protein
MPPLLFSARISIHIARELLGDAGVALLRKDGQAIVFKLRVPGEIALKATHPFVGPTAMLSRGDLPNLVAETLRAWSFRKARPGYQSSKMQVDYGLVFERAVPASWIIGREVIDDALVKDKREVD